MQKLKKVLEKTSKVILICSTFTIKQRLVTSLKHYNTGSVFKFIKVNFMIKCMYPKKHVSQKLFVLIN